MRLQIIMELVLGLGFGFDLDRRDRNCSVKGARAEGEALAHVIQDHVALHLYDLGFRV
jgi:hypothetical protein